MGSFLIAAHKVLSDIRKPLSAKDITQIALENGFLQTSGLTPWQSMKARLSEDILKNKNASLFMRTEQGKFGLREWQSESVDEYVADRFVKSLMDEAVVVFPSSSLPRYISKPGLHTITLDDSQTLLTECFAMQRTLAEEDFTVIQLVSVFIVRNGSQILTYKRTRRLPESRLHNFYSIGFGGHLNPSDVFGKDNADFGIAPMFNIFEPNAGENLLQRELSEELRFPPGKFPAIKYKGILYDDSQLVSTQHLGIVYDVYLKGAEFKVGERGFLMDAKFENLQQIEERINDFENWSVLIAEFERQDRNNLNK